MLCFLEHAVRCSQHQDNAMSLLFMQGFDHLKPRTPNPPTVYANKNYAWYDWLGAANADFYQPLELSTDTPYGEGFSAITLAQSNMFNVPVAERAYSRWDGAAVVDEIMITTDMIAGMAFKIPSSTPTGTFYIRVDGTMSVSNIESPLVIRFTNISADLSSNPSMALATISGGTINTAVDVVTDVWYYLEFRLVYGINGYIEIRIDEQVISTYTGMTTSYSSGTNFSLGNVYHDWQGSPDGEIALIDDIYVINNEDHSVLGGIVGFQGQIRVLSAGAFENGPTQEFPLVGTVLPEEVMEIPLDDQDMEAKYATVDQNSVPHTLQQYEVGAVSLGASDLIVTVMATVIMKSSAFVEPKYAQQFKDTSGNISTYVTTSFKMDYFNNLQASSGFFGNLREYPVAPNGSPWSANLLSQTILQLVDEGPGFDWSNPP